MNISQLEMVNRHADARRSLLHRIDIVDAKRKGLNHDGVVITIDGVRQSVNIVAVALGPILTELRAELAQLEQDLVDLGVRLD